MTQCTKRLKMQLQRVILNAFERMNMYLLKTLRKIFLELIEGSKAIIVDLSGSNPNVFYEMGMAHARGRVVIPICEKDNSQTLPFDVSQFRTIFFHKDNDWGLKGLTDSLIQTLKVI